MKKRATVTQAERLRQAIRHQTVGKAVLHVSP
jgi:hypothetical protein